MSNYDTFDKLMNSFLHQIEINCYIVIIQKSYSTFEVAILSSMKNFNMFININGRLRNGFNGRVSHINKELDPKTTQFKMPSLEQQRASS